MAAARGSTPSTGIMPLSALQCTSLERRVETFAMMRMHIHSEAVYISFRHTVS